MVCAMSVGLPVSCFGRSLSDLSSEVATAPAFLTACVEMNHDCKKIEMKKSPADQAGLVLFR